MRRPSRSAVTSSSVSKNHSLSSTRGSSCSAASRRSALKPHWASLKRPRRVSFKQQVVGPRDQLALGAAHDVRAAGEARPDGDVAVPRQQRRDQGQQRRQARWRGRRPCRRRPGPGSSTTPRAARSRGPCGAGAWPRRPCSEAASSAATAAVSSVLALSTTVTRARKGNDSSRKRAQLGDPLGQLRPPRCRRGRRSPRRPGPGGDRRRPRGSQGCHGGHGAGAGLRAP